MWRGLLVGLLIGWGLSPSRGWALRIARPPEFTEWTPNTFAQLNQTLLDLWNLTNGRYQLEIATSDPDGTRTGARGELVLYDPGAAEEFCVNVDGASDWDCAALAP